MTIEKHCYEIYLPLTYNDGRKIEPIKFKETKNDIVAKFGDFTVCPMDKKYASEGIWTNGEGRTYVDMIITMKIITKENADGFFRDFKEILKKRFRQEEIFITKSAIETI